MNSLQADSIKVHELWRLSNLLPDGLRSQVIIVQSQKVSPSLITTEKVGKNQFSIQIDLISWQQLNVGQRDLLFWYETARIQNKTIKKFLWEMPAIAAGLSTSLMEVMSQNLFSLSVALFVTGIASYQLYQRNQGERSLREATAADRQAIALAMQSGYSVEQAYSSLQDALNLLAKQTSKKSRWKKYQVRLRVLEILAVKDKKNLQQAALKLGTTATTRRGWNLTPDPLVYETDCLENSSFG
jgi:Protein of unknown function (DUF3318)